MARFYHVAVASVATGSDIRWLDNLLSRHRLRGVERAGQGQVRKISFTGLVHIMVVRHLTETFGMTMTRAVEVAARLSASGDHQMALGAGLTLHLDLARLQRDLEHRIRDAAEIVVAPRRGRPPRIRKSRHP